MTRLEGERVRVIQHLKRLRTIVDSVLADLERNAPIPGPDVAQAVAHTGIDVARSLSALQAYAWVEEVWGKAREGSGT